MCVCQRLAVCVVGVVLYEFDVSVFLMLCHSYSRQSQSFYIVMFGA